MFAMMQGKGGKATSPAQLLNLILPICCIVLPHRASSLPGKFFYSTFDNPYRNCKHFMAPLEISKTKPICKIHRTSKSQNYILKLKK